MAAIDYSPVGLIAGADLSAKQYRFGKMSSSNVVACSVAGERADGVIVNATAASGLSLIHISEPTRPCGTSRMPSSA